MSVRLPLSYHCLALAFLFAITASGETVPRLSQILQHPPNFGGPAVSRDFDRDGDLDIIFKPFPSIISSTVDGQGTIIENLGGRSFGPPRRTHHRTIADGETFIGDFISDEQLDFLVTESSPSVIIDGAQAQRPVAIRVAPPGSTEQRMPLASFGKYVWIGIDLDNDEAPELLQLQYPDDSSTLLALLEKKESGDFDSAGITSFPALLDFDADSQVIDLDNDGDLDLVTRDLAGISPILIERTGPRTFSPVVHRPESDLPFARWNDLDGDGLPDLYKNDGQPFTWQKNLGGFTLDSPRTENPGDELSTQRLLRVQELPSAPSLLTFGSIDADKITLTTLRFGTWETVTQSNIAHPSGFGEGEPEIVLADDIDGDSHPDALIRYRIPYQNGRTIPRLAISWGSASGFSPLSFIHPPAAVAINPVIGDFDHDNDVDLILGPDIEGFHHLFLNDGRGRFLQSTRIDSLASPSGAPAGTQVSGIHSGDINGDSILDLVVDYSLAVPPLGFQSACGIALGQGDGSFLPPLLPEGSFETIIESPCGVEELVDWDGDGDLDAVGDGVWRENIGGAIDPAFRSLIGAAQSSDILGNPITTGNYSTGDLDGDGNRDICSATFRIIYGQGSGGLLGNTLEGTVAAIGFGDGLGGIAQISEFPALTLGTDLLGNPTSGEVAFVDLNADGHTDLAITEFKNFDILGNPSTSYSWRRNPGNGSRDPASWPVLPLSDTAFPSSKKVDFNGDLTLEWVSLRGYLEPTLSGPRSSPVYNLTGNADLTSARMLGSCDFDGDGDADFLIGDRFLSLMLLKNPLVEERSAITRYLIQKGVSPHLAGPDRDLDGDGRSNADEFLEGTNPLVAEQVRQNPFDIGLGISGDSGTLQFSIPYYSILNYPEDLNLAHTIESSSDLKTWAPVDRSEFELILYGGGRSYLFLPFEITAGNGFYRMNAQHLLDE